MVVVTFAVAELWQLFFGALSSLQLGAPGVGDRASWVPNVLVAETYTILPLGFLLCLWGAPAGRVLAGVCAAASLVLAVAAVITLSAPESSFIFFFALLAPPGLALLLCILRMRRPGEPTRPSIATSLGRAWGRLRMRGDRRA
jgi:hypothetical protein